MKKILLACINAVPDCTKTPIIAPIFAEDCNWLDFFCCLFGKKSETLVKFNLKLGPLQINSGDILYT